MATKLPKPRNTTERMINGIMRKSATKVPALNDVFDLVRQLQVEDAVIVDGEPVFDQDNFKSAAWYNSEIRK